MPPSSGTGDLEHWLTTLVESRHPALLSRALSTAVSFQLSGRHGGPGFSVCGAAAGVCKVRLCALSQLRWGLLGGRVEDGERLCGGGEGCWFYLFSASPGYSCLPEIMGGRGDRLIPLPTLSSPLPLPQNHQPLIF